MVELEEHITPQHLLGWGLGIDDYQEMFDLKEADLGTKILDCFSGATSFNADANRQKANVLSCDPLYQLKGAELNEFVFKHLQELKSLLKEQTLSLDNYPSLDALIAYREQQIQKFLDDIEQTDSSGRYISHPLSEAYFDDKSFDLALCSHDLFAEHSNDIDFHIDIISRLSALADEIRIFPLLNQNSEISELVGPITLLLQQNNFGVEIREVKYHLQPKGNAMLRIWAQECAI